MERNEILNKLKEIFKIVVHSNVDLDSLTEDANIMLDLGINSIGLLYMAIAIEKEFLVDMTRVSPASFKTIGDVVTYIENKTK